MAITLTALLSTALAQADEVKKAPTLKSADVLQWDQEAQDYYLKVSISMLILITKQNDTSKGQCIDQWFANDPTQSLRYVVSIMSRFPEYHPQGVLIAVVEKECGLLAFKK